MCASIVENHPVIQWKLPNVGDILDSGFATAINEDFIQQRARIIEETLASFGAPAQVVAISRGPWATQFGVEPLFLETRGGMRTKVRVGKIASLSNDLAMSLSVPSVDIQAPVPGHSYVGIEVPNEEMAMVALRDILESEIYARNTMPLNFGVGRDVAGTPIIASLESMPHMLISGAMGSGKSVCLNSILTCLLLFNTPDDLRLVLVDPKRAELTGYNGIPHLLGPVVVEMDRVIGALQWMTREMDKRYHLFAQAGSRNIVDYNAKMKLQRQKKLPYLVIIVDELTDLMRIAPDETKKTILRLSLNAHSAGIHIIIATQRTEFTADINNFTGRISFAIKSTTNGYETLLRPGDMLFQYPGMFTPLRLQGTIVSDHEIQKLIEYWRTQAGGGSSHAITGTPTDLIPKNIPFQQAPLWDETKKVDNDPIFDDAVKIVRKEGLASVSMLQRRLRIGYTRASRIVDMMEDKKIVGPPEGGTQMRAVLDYGNPASSKIDS